jgi:DNA-binding transcriptional LysR family regulator
LSAHNGIVKGKLNTVYAPAAWVRRALILCGLCKDDAPKIDAPSIEFNSFDNTFSTNEWKDWTPTPEDAAFSSQPPIVMEHFVVALQAVLSGIGVALLPEILVNDRIARGELDQFSERVEWPHAFYLVHPPNAQKVERTRRVMEWFEKAVAEQAT